MMMPGNPAGALSLYQMYQQNPAQAGFFGGQSNQQRSPQMWWQNYLSPQSPNGDRADQQGNQNQPDQGGAMGSTPGYDPGWMRWFAGNNRNQRPNTNQAMSMGMLGLSMLQPRYSMGYGNIPWMR